MTADELYQIGTAVLNSSHIYLYGQGTVVSLRAVLNILNSHCNDADLVLEDSQNRATMTFNRPKAAVSRGENGR